MEAVLTIKDDYVPQCGPCKTFGNRACEHRTLGWGILRWARENFREDWKYTPSQVRTILRWYEIDEHGKFVYTQGALQLAKGTGKGPYFATLAAVEFLGPAKFSHFDDKGRAVGKHADEPWVQLFAVNIDQTKNVMLTLHSLFHPDAIAKYGIDPGQERYHARHPDGTFAILEAKTASYRSAEGGRPSALFFDETWHWNESNGGHNVFGTATANAAKVGGRILMATNAYIVGEDSVAERVHVAWQRQQDGKQRRTGLYYEARTANPDFDIEDEQQLRAAIAAAYGDAYWADIDAIIDQCYSGVITYEEILRKYCNLVTASEDSLIDPVAWGRCEVASELRRGDQIALGLDGGEADDSTALVAIRVRDSFIQPIAIWEKPDGPEAQVWKVDKEQVSGMVDWCFQNYKVQAFFSDVAFWETWVNQWSEQYGPRLAIRSTAKSAVAYDMRGNQREITDANMAFVGAVEQGLVKHNGHFGLKRHVENAKKRHNKFGIGFGKASRDSQYKVDAYAATLAAYIARRRLVESGKNTTPKPVPKYQVIGGF
ncbi:terminase TerL endonuclease subunit [Streptomyces sp. NPDC004111]|uniref:terminase TerL endonuclease subunit n=1 Tax=Streptomyces sp. NPDC004111 TaxID=3364690 RepID=UPI0036C5ACB6